MAGLDFKNIFKDINRDLRKIKREVVKASGKEAAEELKRDIVKTIESGNSPVKGQKRFEKYSDSYQTAIKDKRYPGKRIRPVNLKLTGELLRSIASRVTTLGITIFFTKKVKSKLGTKNLAEIHSFEGAGKSKTIRMIIPEKDGDFKTSVKLNATNTIKKTTEKIVRKYLRRYK